MVTTMVTRHHNQSASRILRKLPLKSNLPLMASFMQRGPGAERIVTRLWRPFTSILGATSHKPDVESKDHWEKRENSSSRDDRQHEVFDRCSHEIQRTNGLQRKYVRLCRARMHVTRQTPWHLVWTVRAMWSRATTSSQIDGAPKACSNNIRDHESSREWFGHTSQIPWPWCPYSQRIPYRLPDPTVLWVPM